MRGGGLDVGVAPVAVVAHILALLKNSTEAGNAPVVAVNKGGQEAFGAFGAADAGLRASRSMELLHGLLAALERADADAFQALVDQFVLVL